MLGLKRGAVALYPHEKAWEAEALETMARLRQILGPDDVEDKWIAAPTGVTFTPDEIEKEVHFQEQYFRHEIEIYKADEV